MTAEAWKVRLGAVTWFVLGLGFLLSVPILFDWAAWVFAAVLVCAAVLAAPTAWLLRALFARGGRGAFARTWLRSAVAWTFLLSIGLAAPIYYLATITETRPALAPQATLTNGRKTVVFQGMLHVASENFYKAVIYDVEKALADGYVLYYESVQTATPESKEFFAKLSAAVTGGQTELAGAYRALAEACGLKFQADFFTLLEADQKEHPERHVIADVDALDMKREYERLMRTDPAFAKAHAGDFQQGAAPGDSTAGLASGVEWLKTGSAGQKKLAGVVCRGVMTLAYAPKEDEAPIHFAPIILDFRNRELVRRIVEEPSDKIFITYGARHLDGVIELLRRHDPAWKVASVKWLRTIEMPKRFERELKAPGGA